MENRYLQDACQKFHDRSSRLTMLNLSGKGIGNSGMKRLVENCSYPRPSRITATTRPQPPYQSPLVCLWMENNDLYPQSMEDLAQLFAISPSLRHLHLSHNFIGNRGVRALAQASFSQLESCSLSDNEIGPAGAEAVADHLRHVNCVVVRLNLNGNQLGDEGVMNLCEGLKENTTLKSLDLRYNHVSIRGLLVIREMLAAGHNMTLEMVHLEEDEDDGCCLPTPPPPHFSRNKRQAQSIHPACPCDRCQLKSEINFYLSLNRSGRHSFADLRLKPALWSRILAKSSKYDPSLIHAALLVRPDILLH